MDKRLEKKLVEKYPNIFRDYGGDIQRTCMGWGMSCGDGWFQLIDKLCEDIINIIGDETIEVIALQVKEKFGGLRFYYSIEENPSVFKKLDNLIRNFMFSKRLGKQYWKVINFKKKFWKTTHEKISDIVEQAERDSYKICETCSRPGEVRDSGWIKTSCEFCNEQFKEGKRPWEDKWEYPESLTIYELMFGKDNEKNDN